MESENTPVFPVAALTVGPVPRLGLVVIRPDFLATMTDAPEDAQKGRSYALTEEQARYLVEQIQRALVILESAPLTGAGHPQH